MHLPVPEIRGMSLDVGRKGFDVDWIARLITVLGELGLNTLHLHLSDSTRVGVALPGLEQLAAPDALDASALARLHRVAATAGVSLVPEVDLPGHARALLRDRPKLHLVDRHGVRDPDRLDIASPAGRAFASQVVDGLLGLFDGPLIHLGGDEFFAAPWEDDEARDPQRWPGLISWAREATLNPDATAHDGYALYVAELHQRIVRAGRSTVLWNDHVVPACAEPVVPIPREVILDVWIRWRSWTPSVEDYLASGHRVINSHGDRLYFVLSADAPIAVTGPKSATGIAESFHPRGFMGLAGQGVDLDVPPWPGPGPDPVLGASTSVWCDAPAALDQDQVWDRLQPWLAAFASTMRPVQQDEAHRFGRAQAAASGLTSWSR